MFGIVLYSVKSERLRGHLIHSDGRKQEETNRQKEKALNWQGDYFSPSAPLWAHGISGR